LRGSAARAPPPSPASPSSLVGRRQLVGELVLVVGRVREVRLERVTDRGDRPCDPLDEAPLDELRDHRVTKALPGPLRKDAVDSLVAVESELPVRDGEIQEHTVALRCRAHSELVEPGARRLDRTARAAPVQVHANLSARPGLGGLDGVLDRTLLVLGEEPARKAATLDHSSSIVACTRCGLPWSSPSPASALAPTSHRSPPARD